MGLRGGGHESREQLGQPADAGHEPVMKQNLGIVRTMAYVVGTIIGSGIFISPKGVLQNSGLSVGVSLLVWACGGVVSMMGAFLYSELATRFPRSGSTYVYIKETWGHLVTFVFLWSNIFVVRPSGLAVLVLTVVTYIVQPIYGSSCSSDVPDSAMPVLGSAILLALTYINYLRSGWGARVQTFCAVGKVFGIVIIIVTGLVLVAKGNTSLFTTDSISSYEFDPGSLVFAFYSSLWAYSGYTAPTNGTSEIRDVRRTLPVAIVSGTMFVTVVYMLTNIAYYTALTPEQIVASSAVAYRFADLTLGASWGWIIPLVVCVSVLGTLNSSIFSNSRYYYAAGAEGHLPRVYSLVSVKTLTPVGGFVISTVLALVMLWVLPLYELINYLSFTAWLEEAFVSSGLIYLRAKDWHRERRGKTEAEARTRSIHFPLVGHVLFCLFAIMMTTLSFIKRPGNNLIGLGILCVGIPVYYLFIKYDILANRLKFIDDKVTVWFQMIFTCVTSKVK